MPRANDLCWIQDRAKACGSCVSVEKQEVYPQAKNISLRCCILAFVCVLPLWALIIGVIVWVRR